MSLAVSYVAISLPRECSRPWRTCQVTVPVVVRMEGTNVEEGRQILAESGLNFRIADNMADAAHKVVQAIQG